MRSLKFKLCVFGYAVSFIVFSVLTVKLAEIRSSCTKQKAEISKLVKKVKKLKSENRELMIEFYREVKPKKVDNSTNYMKLLHENEVIYLK